MRADGVGLMAVDGLISSVGFLSLDSWYGLSKIMNSVLIGLSDRSLADIQMETSEIADCRCWMDERNCDGRKEM